MNLGSNLVIPFNVLKKIVATTKNGKNITLKPTISKFKSHYPASIYRITFTKLLALKFTQKEKSLMI